MLKCKTSYNLEEKCFFIKKLSQKVYLKFIKILIFYMLEDFLLIKYEIKIT